MKLHDLFENDESDYKEALKELERAKVAVKANPTDTNARNDFSAAQIKVNELAPKRTYNHIPRPPYKQQY